jgi:hypothetical protein
MKRLQSRCSDNLWYISYLKTHFQGHKSDGRSQRNSSRVNNCPGTTLELLDPTLPTTKINNSFKLTFETERVEFVTYHAVKSQICVSYRWINKKLILSELKLISRPMDSELRRVGVSCFLRKVPPKTAVDRRAVAPNFLLSGPPSSPVNNVNTQT